jgi:uncharacterized protein (TIGR03790 family)
MWSRFGLAFFFSSALALGSCSGGGGTPAPHSTAVPTPSPTASPTPSPVPTAPNFALASHVLVVANGNIPASLTLANQYMTARKVPAANLLSLTSLSSDVTSFQINVANTQSEIFNPIASAITTLGAAGTRIDFVVMMYGTPYWISDSGKTLDGFSVDGVITQVLKGFPTVENIGNPYYGAPTAFTSSAYGIVLVNRLDGRSVSDVQNLITNSLASDGTKPNTEFFFDLDPDRTGDYEIFNQYMQTAATDLTTAGWNAQVDDTTAFLAPSTPLAGYSSWGSNDYHFSQTAYNALTFVPGGIAETAVSTSASNIRTPGGGQSQIADLIHQGVTGVHGDVTEPYLNAIPDPFELFPAYAAGRTLAESFWGALEEIEWKEIVIGDPICSPYQKPGVAPSTVRRFVVPHGRARLPI